MPRLSGTWTKRYDRAVRWAGSAALLLVLGLLPAPASAQVSCDFECAGNACAQCWYCLDGRPQNECPDEYYFLSTCPGDCQPDPPCVPDWRPISYTPVGTCYEEAWGNCEVHTIYWVVYHDYNQCGQPDGYTTAHSPYYTAHGGGCYWYELPSCVFY
jgi:hypothetical protein